MINANDVKAYEGQDLSSETEERIDELLSRPWHDYEDERSYTTRDDSERHAIVHRYKAAGWETEVTENEDGYRRASWTISFKKPAHLCDWSSSTYRC